MYDLYFSGARTAKYVRSIYTSLSQQTKINLLEEVIPPEKHNGEEEDDLLWMLLTIRSLRTMSQYYHCDVKHVMAFYINQHWAPARYTYPSC